MKSFGITVTAKMKHAALWAAAKNLGSQSALARAIGIAPSELGRWCNLQSVPSRRMRDDPEFQRKLFEVTGELVDDLFPQELVDAADFLASPKQIEATQEFDVLQLAHMQSERMSLPSPEMTAQIQEQSDAISAALMTLNYREREIVKLRYGIGGGFSFTLEEVGHLFGITRDRVRQIEAKALRKLQQPSRSERLLEACIDV